jgi:hypothetical protein
MIRVVQLAILIALAVGASTADAAPYSQRAAEKTIRDNEVAWVAAEVSGDPSVAKRILGDDYVGVFPDGSIGTKADVVAFFNPANASQNGRLDYVHIRFFGDTAIAQGQEMDTRPRSSPTPSGRLIFTDVFVRRAGQWRLVNSEDQFQPLAR